MPTGRGCKVTPVDHVETESKRGGGDEDVEREGKTSLRYSFAIVLSCRGDRPGVTKSAGEEEIKTIVPDISVIEKHMRVIQSLQRAGLYVTVLRRSSDDCTDSVVVLVSASGRNKDGLATDERGLLGLEKRKQKRAQYVRNGVLLAPTSEEALFHEIESSELERVLNDIDISPADEIVFTEAIIRQALSLTLTHDFDEVSKHLLAVVRMFPLHDKVVNRNILRLARKTPFIFSSKALRRYARRFRIWISCSGENRDDCSPDNDTIESDDDEITRFIDLLYSHFGMQTAFYFKFIAFYTSSIVPVALALSAFYLVFRFASWNAYILCLAIVGTSVTVIWAPWFVCSWRRESLRLLLRWNRINSGSSSGDELTRPNPHSPEYELTVTKSGEIKRKYDPRNHRSYVRTTLPLIFILNIAVMAAVVILFVQFWAYGKMAPTCACCNFVLEASTANSTWLDDASRSIELWEDAPEDCMKAYDLDAFKFVADSGELPTKCEHFVHCFHSPRVVVFVTDRWYMILIQGIVMGLGIDILQLQAFLVGMKKLTSWENWATESQFNLHCIRKQFTFVWLNMYAWYWFVGLIAVPFGEEIQEWLVSMKLGGLVPPHGWKQRVVSVDEAFVTPLVATAFLNLVVDTLLPFLLTRIMRRQAILEKNIRRQLRKISVDKTIAKDTVMKRELTDRMLAKSIDRMHLSLSSSMSAAKSPAMVDLTTYNRRRSVSLRSSLAATGIAAKLLRRRRKRSRRLHAHGEQRSTSMAREMSWHNVLNARLKKIVPGKEVFGRFVDATSKFDFVSRKRTDAIARSEQTLAEFWDAVSSRRRRMSIVSPSPTSSLATISTTTLIDFLRDDPQIIGIVQARGGGVLRPLVNESTQERLLATFPEHLTEYALRQFCVSEICLWFDFAKLKSSVRERYVLEHGVPRCMRRRMSTKTSRRIATVQEHNRREILAAKGRIQLARKAAIQIRIKSLKILKTCNGTTNFGSEGRADDTRNAYLNALVESVNEGKDRDVHVGLDDVSNDENVYDADEVIEQSHRPPFDTSEDILDMLLQLGYVVQFSVCWPFTMICAMVNNYFEIHCDLFRCMENNTRPVPRSIRSIGQWTEPFWWIPLLAIPITSLMIVCATGQLERWSHHCDHLMEDEVMAPRFECFENPLFRVVVCLVLIFVFFVVVMIVYHVFKSPPPSVVEASKKDLRIRQKKMAEMLMPRFSEDIYGKLRNIFEAYVDTKSSPSYDTSHGHMRQSNLRRMIDRIQRVRGLQPLSNVQMSILFGYMDVLKKGEISFSDFVAGLSYAKSDYTLKVLLRLNRESDFEVLFDVLRK